MEKTSKFIIAALVTAVAFQFAARVSSYESFNHLKEQGLEGDAAARSFEEEHGKAHEVHCSRDRSRAAWKVIEEYLMPFVERERYEIPRSCRLHPDNYLYRDHEQNKIRLDFSEWRCGYCKKSFVSEKFLDQHLDNRHYDLLNFSQGKCLADLCGALHCDLVINSKAVRSKCNPAAAARNRRICESLADSCFPVSQGASASRLHELFLDQFCEAHTCSRERKPFARGGMKQYSVLYWALSILTLMMLPLFYIVVYLHQSEIRKNTQELKRMTRLGRKSKPS
ncbi:hypothetical protein Dimus_023727 [Dionaea muscipula]